SPSERLAAGEVLVRRVELPGGGPPEIRVEAIIDAAPADVWPVIEDCGRYRHTMPRISASEELSFKDGVQVCKVTVDAPFPLSDLTAVTRVEVRRGPPVWTRRWTLLRGDYKTNTGSWTLTPEGPDGRRSRVKYRVRVDPDIPVPGVVQAMAQEQQEIGRFDDMGTRYASLVYRTTKYRAKMNLVMPFISIFSTLLILGYGGQLVVDGVITVGTYTAFFAYMYMVTGPIGQVGGWLSTFTSAAAAAERLFEVLDYEPEIEDDPRPTASSQIQGRVEFRHFSYAYPGATDEAIHDISLTVDAGETVAFLGRIGCGKSTVLRSLVRMNDPAPGMLLIDGEDVRAYPLQQLRSQVALIPQDPFLFSLTIRDNLTYDEPDRDMPPIEHAAQLAELLDAIDEFPDGMETVVGERGITLSGGQKQRATLARGLIRDARILAMDDCFSSVDTRTEERILGRLKEVRQGRTTLLVSHRVSTARHADRIFVMENGRILESGTHAELMMKGGYYADLEAVQSNQDQDRERKAALLKNLDVDVRVVNG
ncbi:MAG: ATP-binding cassette domain-containing protein, partial [Pseudomonadota bacterium]|nr:ATP-binding cassette domain-containing protein [Pseudomonadota bacterium]